MKGAMDMMLIGNGRLITRDDTLPFVENGCVAVEDGFIKEVGTTAELKKKYGEAQFVDAKGGVIMPGMINAHNHIYSAFARGMALQGYNPHGFLDILDGLWWRLDRHLLLKDTEASADATFIDCIENGVTTIFDHHASYGEIEGSLFCIAESAKKYGVRANLCYEISDRDGQEKMKAALRENVDFITWARKEGGDRVQGMMGMHALFTLSDKTLDYCISRKPEGVGCHIHVAEGIEDVQLNLKEHGKRPVFRLHDFGILGEKTICGHCTHVSEAEIDLLRETGTMVAHNPESNMGNAIGCPPSLRMFQKGILIGLGTDGYTNDMVESYKVGNLLHKHSLCDATVAWGEIPAMLFENNRKMAGRYFKEPVGILAPGAHADIIVLDYTPLTPMTADNMNSHVMFGMNGKCVTTTMIGGEIKMLNRELIGVDKERVLTNCRQRAADLWKRI
ncbi:putative aminohydrolase SsnA [bioreactor metagenome]|uniref:Putative aminohydrolase SsnA n=1 Tax=bioreactor metagenome TaxID=1076179 RepID=A0A644YS30_9ZZZZ